MITESNSVIHWFTELESLAAPGRRGSRLRLPESSELAGLGSKNYYA